MSYLKKAEIILNSNFRMFGVGNFDLSLEDIAEILLLLDNPDAENTTRKLYEQFEKQRMG